MPWSGKVHSNFFERSVRVSNGHESTTFNEGELLSLSCGENLTDFDLPGFQSLNVPLPEHFYGKRGAQIATTAIDRNPWRCLKLAQDAVPVAE
jgi:hypothetical protein